MYCCGRTMSEWSKKRKKKAEKWTELRRDDATTRCVRGGGGGNIALTDKSHCNKMKWPLSVHMQIRDHCSPKLPTIWRGDASTPHSSSLHMQLHLFLFPMRVPPLYYCVTPALCASDDKHLISKFFIRTFDRVLRFWGGLTRKKDSKKCC